MLYGLGYPEASMDIVGSYRRGVATSGDIDVILFFHRAVQSLDEIAFAGCDLLPATFRH